MKTPEILYHIRGQVERGNGRGGYLWFSGYSETTADGSILYPWMTAAECRDQARSQGAVARFDKEPAPCSDSGPQGPAQLEASADE